MPFSLVNAFPRSAGVVVPPPPPPPPPPPDPEPDPGATRTVATLADARALRSTSQVGDTVYVEETGLTYTDRDDAGDLRVDGVSVLAYEEDTAEWSETGVLHTDLLSSGLRPGVVFGSAAFTTPHHTFTDLKLHDAAWNGLLDNGLEPPPRIEHVTGGLNNTKAKLQTALELGGHTAVDVSYRTASGARRLVAEGPFEWRVSWLSPAYDPLGDWDYQKTYPDQNGPLNWLRLFAEEHEASRTVFHDVPTAFSGTLMLREGVNHKGRRGKARVGRTKANAHEFGWRSDLYLLGGDRVLRHLRSDTPETAELAMRYEIPTQTAMGISSLPGAVGFEIEDLTVCGNMPNNPSVFEGGHPEDGRVPHTFNGTADGTPLVPNSFFRNGNTGVGFATSNSQGGRRIVVPGEAPTPVIVRGIVGVYGMPGHGVANGYPGRAAHYQEENADGEARLDLYGSGHADNQTHGGYYFNSPRWKHVRLGWDGNGLMDSGDGTNIDRVEFADPDPYPPGGLRPFYGLEFRGGLVSKDLDASGHPHLSQPLRVARYGGDLRNGTGRVNLFSYGSVLPVRLLEEPDVLLADGKHVLLFQNNIGPWEGVVGPDTVDGAAAPYLDENGDPVLDPSQPVWEMRGEPGAWLDLGVERVGRSGLLLQNLVRTGALLNNDEGTGESMYLRARAWRQRVEIARCLLTDRNGALVQLTPWTTAAGRDVIVRDSVVRGGRHLVKQYGDSRGRIESADALERDRFILLAGATFEVHDYRNDQMPVSLRVIRYWDGARDESGRTVYETGSYTYTAAGGETYAEVPTQLPAPAREGTATVDGAPAGAMTCHPREGGGAYDHAAEDLRDYNDPLVRFELGRTLSAGEAVEVAYEVRCTPLAEQTLASADVSDAADPALDGAAGGDVAFDAAPLFSVYDPDADGATVTAYRAASSDEAVATVAVSGASVTVSRVAAGTAALYLDAFCGGVWTRRVVPVTVTA